MRHFYGIGGVLLVLAALGLSACELGKDKEDGMTGVEDTVAPEDSVIPADTVEPDDTVVSPDTVTPDDAVEVEPDDAVEVEPDDVMEVTEPDTVVPPGCGDGTCAADEDPCSCPEDCTDAVECCVDADCPQPECGPCCIAYCTEEHTCTDVWLAPCCWNGECEEGETPDNCPEDCPVMCGDGLCSEGETAENCPEDCGKCLDEGAWWVFEENGPCCGGLTELLTSEGILEGQCAPLDCGVFHVCTKCGDGACGQGENFCSCPEDCPGQCLELGNYSVGAGECCDGNPFVKSIPLDDSPGCMMYVCAPCGDGTCSPKYGENEFNCPADCGGGELCTPEGYPLPADGECCAGTEMLNSNFVPDAGECNGAYCYAPVCAKCGNGECGPGENYCSCPDDCGDLECVQEGGAAMMDLGIFDCCAGLVWEELGSAAGCEQYTCVAQ